MRRLVVLGVSVAGVAALRRVLVERSERELGLRGGPTGGPPGGPGGFDGPGSEPGAPGGSPPIVRA